MMCSHCWTDSVVWLGSLTNPMGTRCQNCGRKNCQAVDYREEDFGEAEVEKELPTITEDDVLRWFEGRN